MTGSYKQKGRLFLLFLLCLFACGCKKEQENGKKTLTIGGLKGPTTMGMVYMMEEEENRERFDFTMALQAQELSAMVAKGEVDIALLPANLGATLYQKTKGEVVAIEINTLGVLYMVSGDKTLTGREVTLEELEGKTIFLTGMGTTPDYALQAMAEKCGIELTLEYASEATEILALLKEEPERIALLPQPFVTSAVMQMEELSVIYDLNRGYEMLMGTPLVTGITIARKEVLDQNPDLVEEFLKQHKESTTAILADPQEGAELVVKAGILPKKEIAQKAIPNCNLTSVTGQNMKEILQPYLQQLYEMDPKVVGGAIPEDEFYYCK